jgi:hypothetical protein
MKLFPIKLIPYDLLFNLQEQLISKNGYAVEVHDVVTEDGFVIGLHRIPYRLDGLYEPDESVKCCRPAVLLVHGGTQTAFDWVANGLNNSLGESSFSFQHLNWSMTMTAW